MYSTAWNLIEESRNITLISHMNPDGDSIGASLALYSRLKSMSKKVSLYCSTKNISKKYDFLPNFAKIKDIFPPNSDLIISSDCGSFDRLGIEEGNFKIINIDHHKSNTDFGDININYPSYASSTLITKELLEYKHKINKPEALCIYTGLVEDTGFFTFSNTDNKTFEMASELVLIGVNPAEVSQQLKMRNPLSRIRLTGLFINSLQLIKDAQIAIGIVTLDDLEATGASQNDSEHLVDMIRNLATVKMAIFIIQQKDRKLKVSLRSKGLIDVSTIAQTFGGGGHKNASGFEYANIDADKLIDQIIKETKL